MAYRIEAGKPPQEWGSLLTGGLGCYDTIGDPDFDMDRDEALHERSALELIRDQLTPDQRAELDQVDAYWRAHPEAFNTAFGVWHHQADRDTELAGFVADDQGATPPIPRSHWWWRPIEGET